MLQNCFKSDLKKNKIIKNFHFAVAPRRDWFEDPTKTLETLDRVFGCYHKDSNKIIRDILLIIFVIYYDSCYIIFNCV